MTTYPIPANEKERLEELFSYQVLDSPVESEFDDIVKIVAKTFRVPAAAITFVDTGRQWIKAETGLGICEIDRNVSVCNYTILQEEVLEVQDLRQDARFNQFPYVASEPGYRYYAGVPLVTKQGYKIGVLCIVDTEVRELDKEDRTMMILFARNIISQLEIRLQNISLHQRNDMQKRISSALSHDICGPLANVKMMLDMQEENSETGDEIYNKEMNTLLKKGVENTMGILNNMIEWGKLRLSGDCSATRFSLRHLADEALNEIYDSNCAKYNTLVNAVPDGIIITAEYEGIRFVLRNLLTNAGKFTQNGCITIGYEKMSNKEMLFVRDSGIGMSPETTARLNRNQQITYTYGTNSETGHGLGLSLVQEYLAKQNKDVYFQSMMGMGTIVSFVV